MRDEIFSSAMSRLVGLRATCGGLIIGGVSSYASAACEASSRNEGGGCCEKRDWRCACRSSASTWEEGGCGG